MKDIIRILPSYWFHNSYNYISLLGYVFWITMVFIIAFVHIVCFVTHSRYFSLAIFWHSIYFFSFHYYILCSNNKLRDKLSIIGRLVKLRFIDIEIKGLFHHRKPSQAVRKELYYVLWWYTLRTRTSPILPYFHLDM